MKLSLAMSNYYNNNS